MDKSLRGCFLTDSLLLIEITVNFQSYFAVPIVNNAYLSLFSNRFQVVEDCQVTQVEQV